MLPTGRERRREKVDRQVSRSELLVTSTPADRGFRDRTEPSLARGQPWLRRARSCANRYATPTVLAFAVVPHTFAAEGSERDAIGAAENSASAHT